MANEVVPFGKYRGKPVEAMREDRAYCDWLVAQDWFREKYSGLFTVVVNNFGEPTLTPEHNALQARFLDDGFALEFFKLVVTDEFLDALRSTVDYRWERRAVTAEERRKAEADWHLRRAIDGLRTWDAALQKDLLRTIEEALEVEFEVGGADVVIGSVLRVEVKPSVGDDYPVVLRTMRANRCSVLLIEEYAGTGVTREQFVTVFRKSGIRVVFLEEVE